LRSGSALNLRLASAAPLVDVTALPELDLIDRPEEPYSAGHATEQSTLGLGVGLRQVI